jgi:hypothetical protein
MRKLWLILPLLAVVLLVGCPTGQSFISTGPIGDTPYVKEGYAIYGGTVDIDGLHPGWSGTVPLRIVNGEDRDRELAISVKAVQPDKVTDGYEPLPDEYLSWVTVTQPNVFVAAGSTVTVPIDLTMPKGADYAGKRAEVRILVEDTTQTGLVQIALEAKWFITTAE